MHPAQTDYLLARLIPFCERNYNLIELGPRGTGKSFVYRETITELDPRLWRQDHHAAAVRLSRPATQPRSHPGMGRCGVR